MVYLTIFVVYLIPLFKQCLIFHSCLLNNRSPHFLGVRIHRSGSLSSSFVVPGFEQAILTVAAHEARPRDVEELMEVPSNSAFELW